MKNPLISFETVDGRTYGFNIPEPAKYRSEFVEAAENCQSDIPAPADRVK